MQGFDPHQGSQFTDALAAGLHNSNVRNMAFKFYGNTGHVLTEFLHSFVNFL